MCFLLLCLLFYETCIECKRILWSKKYGNGPQGRNKCINHVAPPCCMHVIVASGVVVANLVAIIMHYFMLALLFMMSTNTNLEIGCLGLEVLHSLMSNMRHQMMIMAVLDVNFSWRMEQTLGK